MLPGFFIARNEITPNISNAIFVLPTDVSGRASVYYPDDELP